MRQGSFVPTASRDYHPAMPSPPTATNSPKAAVAEMLDGLPENASFEDIQYHVYAIEKIRRGIERAEREGAIPHEDARARLQRWLGE